MKLVVIIPALNEEVTIGDVVRRVPRSLPNLERIETVVIDDGSTDDTATRAAAAGAIVIRHALTQGVGAAFGTGVKSALEHGADLVVNMDGDGQFRPEDIPELLRPILDDGAGFVTCTRFAGPHPTPRMPAIKRWGNSWMTWLIRRICSSHQFTDVSCGFRAYTRDTLLRLNLYGRYTYTQETFINLAAQNVRMAEVSLPVRGTRAHGRSRVAGSIPRYVARTVPIIFRTMRDVRPLRFFGGIAAVVLLVGLALGGFVFGHWAMTGRTHPYQSLLTASAVGIILGFLLIVVALLADMLNRLRRLLEELLYFARRRHYGEVAQPPEKARNTRAVPRDAGPQVKPAREGEPGRRRSIPSETP